MPEFSSPGFGRALTLFFKSTALILETPELAKWYLKTLLRTFFLAALVVVGIVAGGAYGIWHWVGESWLSGVAIIAWVLGISSIAGFLAVGIVNVLVVPLTSEAALVQGLMLAARAGLWARDRAGAAVAPAVEGPPPKATWAQRRRAWGAFFTSCLVALLGWPLLIIPPLMPLGVLLFGWALGREAVIAGERISGRAGIAKPGSSRTNLAFEIGLGVLPAMASLVPVIGWALLPVLLVAGALAAAYVTKKREESAQ